MNDSISRQAAIELCDWYEHDFVEVEAYFKQFNDELKKLPSAQPELIRCKDCKYYEIWQLKADYTDDKRYKPSVCTIGEYSVHRSPDWYCADAERREDAEIH